MKLLFATTNQAKANYYQNLLAKLEVAVLTLGDLKIGEVAIEENGLTPEENARLKVKQYWTMAKIPTMAVDYGLYIDKFLSDNQPGMQVRRVKEKRLSDEEMLDYYRSELDKVGGESEGRWITGMAMAVGEEKIFSRSFETLTYFVSQVCAERDEGEPLNSIQLVKELGKYKAQLTNDEKSALVKSQTEEIINFIGECLEKDE